MENCLSPKALSPAPMKDLCTGGWRLGEPCSWPWSCVAVGQSLSFSVSVAPPIKWVLTRLTLGSTGPSATEATAAQEGLAEAGCIRPWAELDLKEGQALGVCPVVGPPFLQTPRLRNRKGHGSPGDQRGRTGCVGQIWLRSRAGGASQIRPWPSLVGLLGTWAGAAEIQSQANPFVWGHTHEHPGSGPEMGNPTGRCCYLRTVAGGSLQP